MHYCINNFHWLGEWIVGFMISKINVWGTNTLGRFSAMFYKGDNFYDVLFALLYSWSPLEKRVNTKKGRISPPFRSKFFSSVDKGGKNIWTVSFVASIPILLKKISFPVMTISWCYPQSVTSFPRIPRWRGEA